MTACVIGQHWLLTASQPFADAYPSPRDMFLYIVETYPNELQPGKVWSEIWLIVCIRILLLILLLSDAFMAV